MNAGSERPHRRFAGEVAVCHRSNTGAATLSAASRSSSTPPMYLPIARRLSMRREMHTRRSLDQHNLDVEGRELNAAAPWVAVFDSVECSCLECPAESTTLKQVC